jgi:hypothetical protein
MSNAGPEETGIEVKRLGGERCDLREVRMGRIEQPVSLAGGAGGGNGQDGRVQLADESVADGSEVRDRRRETPEIREVCRSEVNTLEVIGNFGGGDNEIRRRVAGVEVDEILDHGERQVLCSVGNSSAWG